MISPFYLLVKLARTRSLQDSPLKCTVEGRVGKHLINREKIIHVWLVSYLGYTALMLDIIRMLELSCVTQSLAMSLWRF